MYENFLKSRSTRWVNHVAHMKETRGACRILVVKPEIKRPLGRLRHRWDDNIKMYLEGIGCEDVDWTHLAQDRVHWLTVPTIMNL
jgi:hypothetical protein